MGSRLYLSGRAGIGGVLLALLGVLAVAAWQATAAFGADSMYWSDDGSGAIRSGNLGGTGSPQSLITGENGPGGVAIDPAAGKIYWAEFGSHAIRVADLGGGAATDLFTGEMGPEGVAIDPTAGKIYWADYQSGAIRVGNLNGTGAKDLFTSENSPYGVAIDPAAGKIYWANNTGGAIRVGNLDGTGSAADLFTGQANPEGVAIDPAAGKIYWANNTGGAIRVGNLSGGGSATDLFTGESGPNGVAIDPAAGKIYWVTDFGAVRMGSLAGGGSASDLFTGESGPVFAALLRSPAGAGAPQISGGSSAGTTLSCSRGSWAPDLLGSFLYRAPRSLAYQWSLNGVDIAGATANSYSTSSAGSYTCRVIAANQAGSSAQTSAPLTVAAAPPRLTSVSQSHRRWREGKALSHTASARPPVGTTFRFTLNESARLRFVFKQRLPGHQVRGRCVAPTKRNRNKPACARLVTRGSLSFSLDAGSHKLRFQGRLSKRKRLPLGRYKLVITATNAAGQRATAKLTFTIVA